MKLKLSAKFIFIILIILILTILAFNYINRNNQFNSQKIQNVELSKEGKTVGVNIEQNQPNGEKIKIFADIMEEDIDKLKKEAADVYAMIQLMIHNNLFDYVELEVNAKKKHEKYGK